MGKGDGEGGRGEGWKREAFHPVKKHLVVALKPSSLLHGQLLLLFCLDFRFYFLLLFFSFCFAFTGSFLFFSFYLLCGNFLLSFFIHLFLLSSTTSLL